MVKKRLPEIKLAKKVSKKYNLTIPADIESIIKKFADLKYVAIPIDGVDGVSINLKNFEGKRPLIIVNSNISKNRQNFTLAHELGHIIIPWHVGTLIDTNYDNWYNDYIYSEMEAEANRFAAEILMPEGWITHEYTIKKDLSKLHHFISIKAKVSMHAAAIRLVQVLPKNIAYTAVENNKVVHSGSTQVIDIKPQKSGDSFDKNFFEFVKHYSTISTFNTSYHWYNLGKSDIQNISENRPWRDILNRILDSIDTSNLPNYKGSLNGVMSNTYSTALHNGNNSLDELITSLYYRIKKREDDFIDLINHDEFDNFIYARAKAFLNK